MPLTDHEIGEQIRDAWKLPIPPMCPRCGYDIHGLPKNRCPECGTVFQWIDVSRRTHTLWCRILRLQRANLDARAGIWFAGGAFVGVVLVHGLHWLGLPYFFLALADIIALALALISLVLGVGTFGAWRIPAHALVHVAEKPNPLLGCAAVLLAVATLCSLVVLPRLLP